MLHLTADQIKVLHGLRCPYCGADTVYIPNSTQVYGSNYGPLYICIPCKAWVGVHDYSKRAKGRVAKAGLRALKIRAHAHFDCLWKSYKIPRNKLYKQLSVYLDIPIAYTHIGMFNEDTCKKVIEWADMKILSLKIK